jgi:hypothetical protein
MAAIQKNFVVKKGLEVNTDLIVASSDTNRVGIGTTIPRYKQHVIGGIGATFATITGVTTTTSLNIVSSLLINGTGASVGQYLGFNTTGLTWIDSTSLGGVRISSAFTATTGQTEFNITYEVGLVDVFVNGVKLSSADFVATDGISILLNTACTGGERVELIAYANVPTGIGVTGIPGINVKSSGTLIGNQLSVVNLNFVGASITTDGTGVGVTVDLGGTWNRNTTGINTLSNVGIGTTNAINTLTVDGTTRIKGFIESQNSVTNTSNILSLNATNGTVFTHTTTSQIGIVSFSGISTARAGTQTFSVIITQGATPVNVTPVTGIGTQLATIITENGVGYSTHIRVGSGTTLTLTNTVGAVDLLTFIVSYDGNTSVANTSFRVIGFAATDFRGVI